MRLRGFVIARGAFLVVAGPLFGQASYPPGEALIGASPLTAFRLTGSNAAATQVDIAGPGFSRAWRIETLVDASPPWSIEFRAPVTRPTSAISGSSRQREV